MKIRVVGIGKHEESYENIATELTRMIGRFASFEAREVMTKEIIQAQNTGQVQAQAAYTRALQPHKNGFCIALDPLGREMDSHAFAKLLDHSSGQVSFFLGGAYGFEREFLHSMDATVSLSKMTMSHRVAKVVLLEQIYRALSILNNHPYHK